MDFFTKKSVLAALLLTTACGSSGHTSDSGDTAPADFPKELLPKALLPDLPLVAPDSDLDTPVFSDIVDIAAGEDITFCTWTNVILDKDQIFAESFGAESPHGHHAIMQYTTNVQDPHTGPCGAMDGNMLLGGSGGKNVAKTPTLPTNYGVSVPKGAQLVINHHWINTSTKAVQGQAMMLVRRLAEGGDTVLAGNFPMLGLGWEIPAAGALTYSTECTYTEDVSYVLALGHMHEFGTQINIDVKRADGTTDSLIDEGWNADSGTTAGGKIFSIDDPYVIHKGDTAKLTCNWANDSTAAVAFPREMCIFFGYTVGTNAYCVNGAWMSPKDVMAAGVDPQQITDHL